MPWTPTQELKVAILIRGASKCSLCGATIKHADSVVAFPAFLGRKQRLAKYSDASFHEHCFDKCPDKEAVFAMYEKWCAIWDSRPNIPYGPAADEWVSKSFKEFE